MLPITKKIMMVMNMKITNGKNLNYINADANNNDNNNLQWCYKPQQQ